LAPSTTTKAFAPAIAILVGGCSAFGGPCDLEPDLTGRWALTFTPVAPDGGTSGIPRNDQVTADLVQMNAGGVLDIGRRLWGTLSSADPEFFGTLTIPQLTHNDGSKSGAALGCMLRINVPLTMDVHDDNVPQPPQRLTLSGLVVAKGQLVGQAPSVLIMTPDLNSAAPPQRPFAWTGTRP
jgi:hypothetical protein